MIFNFSSEPLATESQIDYILFLYARLWEEGIIEEEEEDFNTLTKYDASQLIKTLKKKLYYL